MSWNTVRRVKRQLQLGSAKLVRLSPRVTRRLTSFCAGTIRFWYVVPRLGFLLAGCIFVQFALDPLLKYGLQTAGQSLVGAKVEIGSMRTSPTHLSATLREVRVAKPRDPMRNVFAFEQASLQLDSRALADRRLIIDRGVIGGLQFDVDRDESGGLPEPESPQSPPGENEFVASLTRSAAAGAGQWWTTLQRRIAGDLEGEFHSLPLARQLVSQWRAEYEQSAHDFKRWRSLIDRLRAARDQLQIDPLGSLEQLPGHFEDLRQLGQEVQMASHNLARLREQFDADRRAVESAKQRDLLRLRELARLERPSAQAVSDYLLGEELACQLKRWSEFVVRIKSVVDYVAKPPEWNQQGTRGVDIPLADSRGPAVLVRSLTMSGTGQAGTGEFRFVGEVTDLTVQSKGHDRPAVFEFACQGSIQGRLRAVIDSRGDTVQQQITIHCPAVAHPQYTLGDDNRWALLVEPGTAACWLDIKLDGQRISGDLRWRQDQLELRASAAGDKSAIAAEAMQGVLEQVDRLHAQATLTGTLTRPQFQLRSNLGPALSLGLQRVADRELAALEERLGRWLNRELEKHMNGLAEQLSTDRAELSALLDTQGELFAGLRQVSSRLSLPREFARLKLPLSNVLRQTN